ncbi:MAG: class I SAM-dependent methyltransferase, partial [Chloroflexi bacterium]|nr:class I SAM-dependent methyltransferase [Chloroflexota bacterium]
MLHPYLMKALERIAVVTYRIPRVSFAGRLIEYDFIRANIEGIKKQRILDVGCCGSKLPIDLARQGHEVYGIDVGDYRDQKLFTFVQTDIQKMPFNDNFFDMVSCVSVLEHIGLGRYRDPISP